METVIWELAVAGKCRSSSNSSPQHPPRHIERHHVTEKINIFNLRETVALGTFLSNKIPTPT
jgi:hypothetical protein